MSSDSSGEFHRIRRLPPYVFAEVNTAKAKARGVGEDIIDLGMGNPDSPTPPHIVAKLVETVQDPRSHRYSVSKGIPGLRRALAAYYERLGDYQPWRHHPGAEPVLPDPPVRLHHSRGCGAQHSG
jgi:alanine-synthesizing transaminase